MLKVLHSSYSLVGLCLIRIGMPYVLPHSSRLFKRLYFTDSKDNMEETMEETIDSKLNELTIKDLRYSKDAYLFLMDGLNHTTRDDKAIRHVSGQELSWGLKEYALGEYGALTFALLSSMGIHTTRDFGEIVFNLIHAKVFSKTNQDCIEDFDAVYPFQSVFIDPFRPTNEIGNEAFCALVKKG